MVAAHSEEFYPGPRAFRVFHEGRLIGFLGEEAGTFESASGAAEPGPPGCRYRSLTLEAEGAMQELLHTATHFETLVTVLRRAGLQLEATDSVGLFSPSPVLFRSVVPSSLPQHYAH